MKDVMLTELENAVPRPVSPVYQNISTIAVDHAVAARGHQPAGVGRRAAHLHPGRDRGQGDPAVTARHRHPRPPRRSRSARTTAPSTSPAGGPTRRKRAERKLGLLLVAPAVTIMLAVAAYPIIYAFWLSLNKADLRRPNANEFIGFDNYVTVLSSPIWWRAFGVTMFITVVSASLELVFGMLLAIIMHRTIVGRGLVRTSALVPYGIVTVVAAFSWRFAWTEDLG